MKTNLYPDEIFRSSRKTLSICIDSRGRLVVRAPKRYPEERIFAFLQAKQAWIEKKKAEREQAAFPLPPCNLEGYSLPLFGQPTPVFLTEGKKVLFDGERLCVPKDESEARLVKWIKGQAKEYFAAETARVAAKMGVKYRSVGVSSAKTRWGSCSASDAIRYTFRLIYCPEEIIEYVVVHELAHTLHKNHSKAFWREVERMLPDWKLRRKWLKSHGIFMEIF